MVAIQKHGVEIFCYCIFCVNGNCIATEYRYIGCKSGCLTVWLFGCFIVWLFDYMAVLLFGSLTVWLSD